MGVVALDRVHGETRARECWCSELIVCTEQRYRDRYLAG